MLGQIQALDLQIDKLSEQIQEIRHSFQTNSIEEDVVEDVCLDEVEANKAALEVMRNFCVESMLDLDPEGEA